MFLLYPKLNDLPMKISRRRSTEVIANQGFFNMRLLSFQQLKAIIVIMKFCQKISMTRFGEILPLWQKFTSLWQKFDSLFLFGKMLSLLWQICDIVGLIFSVANGQIFKNNLTIWSHWVEQTDGHLLSLQKVIENCHMILPIIKVRRILV